ncbi:MAG: phosphatidylglycerophosphatase A [Desulfobacteraceae bacterium]|nr:phosphatidylglycerophosphatase A [Desulfobacteraceae bacterium]
MNYKQKSVMFFATGCFIGNISFAPGTFGSILGLALCFLLSKIELTVAVVLTILFVFFAIWMAHEAEIILKAKDPGCIVIDEIAGMLVTLIGLPFNMISVFAGFLIFRILDIWKPHPIRFLERKLSGGVGIVMDDIVAGVLGNIILRVSIGVIKNI